HQAQLMLASPSIGTRRHLDLHLLVCRRICRGRPDQRRAHSIRVPPDQHGCRPPKIIATNNKLRCHPRQNHIRRDRPHHRRGLSKNPTTKTQQHHPNNVSTTNHHLCPSVAKNSSKQIHHRVRLHQFP